MPREPRIRKLHHEERTGNIHREASSFDSVIDTVNKIIDFIDEQYEKEENIVGEMDYMTIPCEKHKFERSCDCHVTKSEEKKYICLERNENDCRLYDENQLPIKTREWIRDYWYSIIIDNCENHNLPEKKRVELEHSVRKAIVDERNTLIDELVKDVDKKCSCSNHVWGCAREIRKDDVIDLLKSKKK